MKSKNQNKQTKQKPTDSVNKLMVARREGGCEISDNGKGNKKYKLLYTSRHRDGEAQYRKHKSVLL